MLAFNRIRPLTELAYVPIYNLQNYLNVPSSVPVRNISLSSKYRAKTIVETQDGKNLVIEGVISPSPRIGHLVKTDPEHSKACPLCRLNLDVKHTDVLILSQFVRPNGSMLPKRITGLCTLQQKRVSFMVTMAHKAGLMGKFKPPNCSLDPTRRPKWKKFNTYFDETTINPSKWFVALKYQQKSEDFKKALQEREGNK